MRTFHLALSLLLGLAGTSAGAAQPPAVPASHDVTLSSPRGDDSKRVRENCCRTCSDTLTSEGTSQPCGCEHPLLAISTHAKELIAGRFEITGRFGPRRDDQVLALLERRGPDGDPYWWWIAHITSWTDTRIEFEIPTMFPAGDHGLAILYNVRPPGGDQFYERGSNPVRLTIRGR